MKFRLIILLLISSIFINCRKSSKEVYQLTAISPSIPQSLLDFTVITISANSFKLQNISKGIKVLQPDGSEALVSYEINIVQSQGNVKIEAASGKSFNSLLLNFKNEKGEEINFSFPKTQVLTSYTIE